MEKAKPAQGASEGRALAKGGADPEEREWLERLGRVKSAVAAGASPVHASPTPRASKPEPRSKSLPAPSMAAKSAGRTSIAPRASSNVKSLADKRESVKQLADKRDKDSSLAALSLSMRLVHKEAYAARVASPPPPPPASARRVQGFPKRLRHAADPTDYDVQIIASYAPPPVPAHLVPRGRVVIVPPDPGFTAMNVARPKRRIKPYAIALSVLMVVAVVATWLGTSREAPLRHVEPSVATSRVAVPETTLPSIASSAEPTAAAPAPVSTQPTAVSAVQASAPAMPLHSSVLAAFGASSSTHTAKTTAHVAHPAKHARAHHHSQRTRRHHAQR